MIDLHQAERRVQPLDLPLLGLDLELQLVDLLVAAEQLGAQFVELLIAVGQLFQYFCMPDLGDIVLTNKNDGDQGQHDGNAD